ncbi:glycosyltransferase [Pontibaca salina]|uniref:Rhamnosyl transferase n=1 Tax=Pontibaca salina TaxID=2795731 RepID=A0A934HUD0_9RHOB|nr:glycosyltransferase [Pontibaca salina]MBI6630950.1 hypothetical protein [Pontibaca salina]
MEKTLSIAGLLRFSVLTTTYYTERFDTPEKTAGYLFSPERMKLRFHLFEHLCLPSLLKQTDQNFTAIVLTAKAMPERYLDRLKALLRPVPNIHCFPVGTGKHYRLIKQGYDRIPDNGVSHRALFRLDDDDAVDRDFIARTRRLATGLMALQTPETPFVIAHNRGFYLHKNDKEPEVFDAVERAPLSVGTTIVSPVDSPVNPYRFNHRNLPQHLNTFTDISQPAFIRTIHGDNKSRPAQIGLTHMMSEAGIDAELQAYFGIGSAQLKSL